MRFKWGLLLVLALCACGGSSIEQSDAGPPDAQPFKPGREITAAGGRVSGGAFKMDVQVGHTVSQQPAVGGSKKIEGSAVIKP
jgi:hypothetical protein